jgi:hypothetical protein
MQGVPEVCRASHDLNFSASVSGKKSKSRGKSTSSDDVVADISRVSAGGSVDNNAHDERSDRRRA